VSSLITVTGTVTATRTVIVIAMATATGTITTMPNLLATSVPAAAPAATAAADTAEVDTTVARVVKEDITEATVARVAKEGMVEEETLAAGSTTVGAVPVPSTPPNHTAVTMAVVDTVAEVIVILITITAAVEEVITIMVTERRTTITGVATLFDCLSFISFITCVQRIKNKKYIQFIFIFKKVILMNRGRK